VSKRKSSNKPVVSKSKKADIPQELKELEQELQSINPEVFQGVPIQKKLEILQGISVVSIRSHSGPLPDAETLIKYDSIIPDGANRIMTMAEKQQNHRIDIESNVVKSNNGQSKLGQIFGLIIGIVGIGCGTYLASIGESTVGGIIAGTTVVSLVSVFVIGKAAQRKKLDK